MQRGKGGVQSVNQHGMNVLMKLKLLNENHKSSIQNAEGADFSSLQNWFIPHQTFYFAKVYIKE